MMPLVHFPASARFDEWSTWPGYSLKSKVEQGKTPRQDRFGDLSDRHVFVYGGPCCYYHDGCIGDAVIYFAPGVELGCKGGATPFDSGSLEHSPARLQPFRATNADEDKRWRFFTKYQVSLEDWRESFADWLAFVFDDPDSYLDSGADRHAAGEPERTRPAFLLHHNGTRGRARYGEDECGDRRAWTWEIRIEGALPFEKIALLHIPFDAFEHVNDFADELERRTGVRPQVKPLPPGVAASFRSLYADSGSILRELIR
ncbi:MAG: hypothetical protein ABJE95_24665 [Byssovorax sp.]